MRWLFRIKIFHLDFFELVNSEDIFWNFFKKQQFETYYNSKELLSHLRFGHCKISKNLYFKIFQINAIGYIITYISTTMLVKTLRTTNFHQVIWKLKKKNSWKSRRETRNLYKWEFKNTSAYQFINIFSETKSISNDKSYLLYIPFSSIELTKK